MRHMDMSVEDRICRLLEEITSCRNEAETIVLSKELRIALHEHFEQLRAKLRIVRSSDSALKYPHRIAA